MYTCTFRQRNSVLHCTQPSSNRWLLQGKKNEHLCIVIATTRSRAHLSSISHCFWPTEWCFSLHNSRYWGYKTVAQVSTLDNKNAYLAGTTRQGKRHQHEHMSDWQVLPGLSPRVNEVWRQSSLGYNVSKIFVHTSNAQDEHGMGLKPWRGADQQKRPPDEHGAPPGTGERDCDAFHCPCSFQMRPVTRSLSSCLPPPEKKSAMFLWMMSPSKLSRTFRWLSLMLRGVPCHVSFRPPPPTSRLYPNPCASLSSPMNRRNAMYTGAIPSRNASKCRQKCCPKHLKTCMYQTQGGQWMQNAYLYSHHR